MVTYLLVDMARMLLYELCKAIVIGSQFTEAIEYISLTGVKKGQFLGYLWKNGIMSVMLQ